MLQQRADTPLEDLGFQSAHIGQRKDQILIPHMQANLDLFNLSLAISDQWRCDDDIGLAHQMRGKNDQIGRYSPARSERIFIEIELTHATSAATRR